VATAARYLPASDEVGGDWYDLFELPEGRIAIAIGDVVGHGVRAAALMGRLRTALHCYATEGHGPARTLELVDGFVQTMRGSAMATAAYAVFDPDHGELRVASAGHLPPVVISGGEVRSVDLVPAPPLGALPYARYSETAIPLRPRDLVALYTDGLIERPGVPLDESIDELMRVVRGATSPEEMCRRAIDGLVPADNLRDDVAIIALLYEELAAELDLRLPAEPRVLAEVRRVLRRWLHAHGAGEQDVIEITLAVGEACTNAVEHAYAPSPSQFELHASEDAGAVTIEVRDAGRWRAPRGTNRGRGLMIMRTVMDGVDVRSGPDGTHVSLRRRLRG